MIVPERVSVPGFPNTAAARANLDKSFDATFGHGWTPGLFDTATQTVAVVQERPDVKRWRLAVGSRQAQVNGLIAEARDGGWDIVEIDFDENCAYVAHLTSAQRALRKRLALFAKVDPWAIEVCVEATGDRIDMVQLLRTPDISADADKALEFWRSALAVIPGADPQWRVERDPISGRVVFTRRIDPLLKVIDYPWDASIGIDSIPFAVDEDGTPVRLKIVESNILIGGIPGSGKSGASTAILAGLSRLEHVAIYGVDLKLVELDMWSPRFERTALTAASAHDLLGRLMAEMFERYKWLRLSKRKKFSADMFNGRHPLIVLVIDELARLVQTGDQKFTTEVNGYLRQLVALGRAAGIVVITMTQKPETSVIPSSFRDLLAQRVAFATTTREMTDTVLGSGVSQSGGDAHLIPQSLKGANFLTNEESRVPRRTRAYWVPDEEVPGLAERTAHLKVGLKLPEPIPFDADLDIEEEGMPSKPGLADAFEGFDDVFDAPSSNDDAPVTFDLSSLGDPDPRAVAPLRDADSGTTEEDDIFA